MKANSKSQVTLFMSVGIVIFLIIGILVYLSIAARDAKVPAYQQQQNQLDVQPVINYLESCIDQTAKYGMALLGKQGGFIYEGQGGSSPQRAHLLDDSGFKVPFRILSPDLGGMCIKSPPAYPTNNPIYPFTDERYSSKAYSTLSCFGDAIPLDISKSLEALESFVQANLPARCNASAPGLFPGLVIRHSSPTIEIVDKNPTLQVLVTYPMNISNPKTGLSSIVSRFQKDIAFDIHSLYTFVNDRITKDRSDPTYNLTALLSADEYLVFSHSSPSYGAGDDLITVQTREPILEGKRYSFSFARRNRPPVLEYAHEIHPLSSVSVGSEIRYEDIIGQKLAAVDPDEDDLNIKVFIGWDQIEFMPGSKYKVRVEDKNSGHVSIKIDVSDGYLKDFQARDKSGRELKIPVI